VEPKWQNHWMIGGAKAHEVPAESIAHYRETEKTRKVGMYVISTTHRRLGAAAQSCVRLDGVLAARYDPALWWLPIGAGLRRQGPR
jgi:hypothetical protein